MCVYLCVVILFVYNIDMYFILSLKKENTLHKRCGYWSDSESIANIRNKIHILHSNSQNEQSFYSCQI